jgi:hypothetical protein
MKRNWLYGVLGLVFFTGCDASAQYFAAIDLAPTQREYIKDYVLKERIKPTIIAERISMGVTVPSFVELRPVPADWGPSVQRLFYFYSGERVHFVDPQSRRVVLDIF